MSLDVALTRISAWHPIFSVVGPGRQGPAGLQPHRSWLRANGHLLTLRRAWVERPCVLASGWAP
jgi:hypothetical protein